MNKNDPLTPDEMQTAASQFFPLLQIVKDQTEAKFFKKDAPLVAIQFDHTEAD